MATIKTKLLKRKCAYCGKEKKLTKEHIWPKCIIKRMPELELKFMASKKVVTTAELVIADVCAECNNVKLSILDNYFCSLYDSHFKNFIEEKKPTKFKYNYELFLRSLLKITYNSSRTKSRIDNDFEKFRDFILNGNEIREDVVIKADLITPAIINGTKLYPKSTRCGTISVDTNVENFILRMISVNSYHFYLIISKDTQISTEIAETEFREIFQRIPGTIVHPYQEEIEIVNFSSEDAYSIHKPSLELNKEHFDKFRKK